MIPYLSNGKLTELIDFTTSKSISFPLGQKKGNTMPEETTDIKNPEQKKVSNLNIMDVIAIIACWAGVVAVTWFSKEHPLVVIIAIASAYYLAKWVILKKEK